MTDGRRSICSIEPLDPLKHDRAAFSCGVEQVDNFFRKTANKLMQAGNSRVWVMAGESGTVIGFYAVNGHSIRFDELPPRYARTRPAHGQIPAAYISMIGVASAHQGQGLGGALLVDALKRLAAAAEALGLAVVVLDVLNCGDAERTERRKTLYVSFGFQPFPSRPSRLFMPMATAAQL